MKKPSKCERMRPYWNRFKWNVRNLFNRKAGNNPYVLNGEGDLLPKERSAFEDLFHSLENLWREYRRLED